MVFCLIFAMIAECQHFSIFTILFLLDKLRDKDLGNLSKISDIVGLKYDICLV